MVPSTALALVLVISTACAAPSAWTPRTRVSGDVARSHDPDDQRNRIVTLTERGWAGIAAGDARMAITTSVDSAAPRHGTDPEKNLAAGVAGTGN